MDALDPDQEPAGDGLRAPLARETGDLLRDAVRSYARGERRRVHPPVLHVGVPGRGTASLVLDAQVAGDHGLRTDVIAALRVRALACTDPGCAPDPGADAGTDSRQMVWLTRCGDLTLQDVDVLWLAAARAAYAEARVRLVFVVVNRRGWRDPRTGTGRTWARVRPGPDG